MKESKVEVGKIVKQVVDPLKSMMAKQPAMELAKDGKKPVQSATLDQIIRAQNTLGYWPENDKSLFDTFNASGFIYDFDTLHRVNMAIDEAKQMKKRGMIIATLVGLFVLMEVFEDQED